VTPSITLAWLVISTTGMATAPVARAPLRNPGEMGRRGRDVAMTSDLKLIQEPLEQTGEGGEIFFVSSEEKWSATWVGLGSCHNKPQTAHHALG